MKQETSSQKPDERRSPHGAGAGEQVGQQEAGYGVDSFDLDDFENAADGICVCHAIDDFPYVRFIYWNRQMFALSGYDMGTINRKGWYQSVYPDPDIQTKAIKRMTQMRVGDNLEAEEWEITRADGQLRTVRISTSVIDNGVGEPRVMAIMHDVTRLKQTQKELSEEREALKQKLVDADQALEISDSRYRALFENAGDAIFIHDLEGTILDVNQKTLDILGYTKAELLSIKVYMLHPPESLEASKWAFEAIMRDGQVTFEIDFIAKNGDVIPTEVTSSIYDNNGRQLIQGIVREIRERQLAEQARRETFAIIESSPATVFLWRNAADWPVEFVTHNVEQIFGYTDTDFLSNQVLYSQVIHPEDIERVANEVETFSQDADRQEFEHIPYRIVTKDGGIRWVNDKTFIRRDHTGSITHYQGIVEDITKRITAEEALRVSEEKFSRAFHSSPDAIVISNLQDGTILEVNEGFANLTGYERKVVMGRSTGDLNLWADPVDRDRYVRMMSENGHARNLEFDFRIKSGEIRNGLLSGEIVQIGSEKCLLGTIRDITELKRVQAEMLREKSFSDTLINQLPGSFYMFADNGQMLRWNENLAKVTAYSNAEIKQMRALDFFTEEDKEHVLERIKEVFIKGQSQVEANFLTKDGVKIPHVLTGTRIEYDGINYLLGVGLDITERKQAEIALNRERKRLAVTLRSIGDGVIATDRSELVTLMNPVAENLTGWSESEAAGKPLSEVFTLINEMTGQPGVNPVQQVLKTGKIQGLSNHTTLICRDGIKYSIADSAAPIKDEVGNVTGVVLVFRDITAAQRTEAELLKMEKLKSLGVLAGGIAHDFNNFLTGIIGNLSLAKLDLDPGNRIHPQLNEMEKAAMRAKDLTQQLLTFSKGGEPVKGLTQIDILVREAALFALRGSNVRCEFDFGDNLWAVLVDTGQMGQVIHNLVINADQAMPEGGVIKIGAKNIAAGSSNGVPFVPGQSICITIEDQGTGINKEYVDKVFDPYFTTKQKGSGLGLAIVYSIIEKHDGYITLDSEPGKGTSFKFYLPASPESKIKDAESEETMASGTGYILIMDDEELIRTLLAKMLKKMGYESEFAQDGAGALEKYKQAMKSDQAFDAVILDLTIPGGMGGKETIAKLVEMDKNVKAIVSSGYSNDPVMSNHKDYGFFCAVKKPYVIKELSEALKKLK